MCNKTSKTIEYYKIFLRWIIKRAHGSLLWGPEEQRLSKLSELGTYVTEKKNKNDRTMAENATFRVEYAARDGDVCAECKHTIAKGTLQIGRVVATRGSGRTVATWYHPLHMFEAMKRWKSSSRRVMSLDDLEGVDVLKPSDVRYIKQLLAGDDLSDAIERLSVVSSEEIKERARTPSPHRSPSPRRSPASRRSLSPRPRLSPHESSSIGRSSSSSSKSSSESSSTSKPRTSAAPVERKQSPVLDWKGDEAPHHLTQTEREHWYEDRRTIVQSPIHIDLFHRRYVKKAKFWEIDASNNKVVTKWGPIGKTGQVLSQTFATDTKARAYATGKVDQKIREGYLPEVTPNELA
jgi:predicted DNA-binding WGR domain protein